MKLDGEHCGRNSRRGGRERKPSRRRGSGRKAGRGERTAHPVPEPRVQHAADTREGDERCRVLSSLKLVLCFCYVTSLACNAL
jgi:hypothetical protein